MYVGDVIGLESETINIPEAVQVDRLLIPFCENGQHCAIPSIEKQKAFVQEQRRRLADIEKYPRSLSTGLRELRDDLVKRIRVDKSGWEEVLKMPESKR